MAASLPVSLMSKATLTKSWLWHRRLSHLNFGTINDLTKHDLVDGILKFKYGKDHLCSAYERGKSKKASHPPKVVPSIMQEFLIARTPQQNGVVERRNQTLVEVARTMLIFSRLPEFLWAGAASTACFTQNQPVFKQFINDDSSAESLNIPSKEDLDNLFGPMYEEYFEKRSSEMTIIFTAQQVHNYEESHSTSSIIIKEHEAPPIVTTSEEQTSLISLNEADEFNQEDFADFDRNMVFVPYDASNIKEVESSTTASHQICMSSTKYNPQHISGQKLIL
ncbi:retrovirus-related pol polyprotein from transposon TNT 1-94 [Tanacetum coccineum]